jgi:hypothetical protein
MSPSDASEEFSAPVRHIDSRLPEDDRLVAALKRIRHGKIDLIALDVGYRSKKNTWRRVSRADWSDTDLLRRLSEEKVEEIIRIAEQNSQAGLTANPRHSRRNLLKTFRR